jgi:hypothetical protein
VTRSFRIPKLGQYDPYTWVPVQETNLDSLPEDLCPTEGCPWCDAVWVDVTSVGVIPPYHVRGALVRAFGDQWVVHLAPILAPVVAVRLRCFSGHVVDFDAKTVTPWSGVTRGAAADVWACYVGPMLAMMKQ